MSDPGGPGRVDPACPICGKASARRFRPFCSLRCAQIDLGRWFGEGYRLPAEEAPEAEAAPSPPVDRGK